MVDMKKIKILAIQKNKNFVGWAKYLGISTSTLYRKLRGETDFYRKEIIKSCEYFEMDNMDEYFF